MGQKIKATQAAERGPYTMTTTPQAALLSESEIVACIAKAGCIGTVKMSYESGPYDIDRPSINASRLYDAIEAAILAKLKATQEPVQVFPPRIMELLEQVADRNPGAAKGPWEDAQGLPMQEDADAAISWIKARSVATQEPVQAGELPPPPTLSDDERQWLHYNPNTSDIEEWVYGYAVAYARAVLSARKPLNSDQIRGMAIQEEFLLVCDSLEDLTCIVREVERAHGIGLEVKP